MHDYDTYLISFDNWHRGHNGEAAPQVKGMKSNSCWFLRDKFFVSGNGFKEEEKMEFEEGMRVITKERCDNTIKGMVGNIIAIDDYNALISFDNWNEGHNGSGEIDDYSGHYIPFNMLEKYEEEKEETINDLFNGLKESDRVKVKSIYVDGTKDLIGTIVRIDDSKWILVAFDDWSNGHMGMDEPLTQDIISKYDITYNSCYYIYYTNIEEISKDHLTYELITMCQVSDGSLFRTPEEAQEYCDFFNEEI